MDRSPHLQLQGDQCLPCGSGWQGAAYCCRGWWLGCSLCCGGGWCCWLYLYCKPPEFWWWYCRHYVLQQAWCAQELTLPSAVHRSAECEQGCAADDQVTHVLAGAHETAPV